MEAELGIGARAGVSATRTGDCAHAAGRVSACQKGIIETPAPITA